MLKQRAPPTLQSSFAKSYKNPLHNICSKQLRSSSTNNVSALSCNTVQNLFWRPLLNTHAHITLPHPSSRISKSVFHRHWHRECNRHTFSSPLFLLPCQRCLCEFYHYKMRYYGLSNTGAGCLTLCHITDDLNFGILFTFIQNFRLPYFPAHKMHFFSRKMWPKLDLRLMRRG
jgi:hypothetical protein